MIYTKKYWNEYIDWLSKTSKKAAHMMGEYIKKNGISDSEALIRYALALVTKYGEARAELACQMYDTVAAASGVTLPPAEPAATASEAEVAKIVNGNRNSPPNMQSGVSRLVKQAGADTTLKNALRDGAEFAWIPNGDTCPFCIALASRGWQRASRNAIQNGHAEHIHANCDCEYAIRFHSDTTVEGYDPERYLDAYESADGSSPKEKINAMRRAHYAENRQKITAQKRAAYAARKSSTNDDKSGKISNIDIQSRQFASESLFRKHYDKHAKEFDRISSEEYLRRANLLAGKQPSDDVVQLVRSDGSVSKYCFSTNEFLVINADGTIRTFFKPVDKEAYWQDELNRN